MIDRLVLYAALLGSCAHAAQPSAPAPVSAPLRELPWGQLNFLHTTDSHGWHAGHLQEPSYSADWGDYISFSQRMKERAKENGVDLLVIDTGDRVEGNGLYDGSTPKGMFTSDVFREQDVDVLTSGNHELYKKRTAEREYLQTVPNFKGNYLASNIDILDPKSGDKVPLAPRFRKFTTENQGIRILAFGFLFDFTGNYNNTFVQPVEKTVQERWFQDAIRDKDVDLILVAGHVAVRSKEYNAVHKAIRQVKWDTPIQFFGGHTHIRDYVKYDAKSYALESGRYMETVGFMSISGLNTGGKSSDVSASANPKFSRRYIDNNLFSFLGHTRLNESDFHTEHGKNVSNYIRDARKSLKLDQVHGCAPHDYWLNRAPFPSKYSALSLMQNHVLPEMVVDDGREDKERMILINSGAIRFDIFKGTFTKDTSFIVSPFQNGFGYIRDVPYESAKQVLPLLNNNGPVFESLAPDRRASALEPPEQSSIKSRAIMNAITRVGAQAPLYAGYGSQAPLNPDSRHKDEKSPPQDLTPGYTTKDDAGDDGDDTIHSPITFYRVPACIQSEVGFSKNNRAVRSSQESDPPETVDLVFIEFLQPWILLALQFLGEEYETTDVLQYGGNNTFTGMLSDWVEENWEENC
ncbi:MAG: Calcium-transporting ATPase 10, plasma membrane-type [Chaenotheca gracillima]|nr:MAG: Calcium-transporting ATPase 10, plasma membrane-type [Chaenotheca gracillima]